MSFRELVDQFEKALIKPIIVVAIYFVYDIYGSFWLPRS